MCDALPDRYAGASRHSTAAPVAASLDPDSACNVLTYCNVTHTDAWGRCCSGFISRDSQSLLQLQSNSSRPHSTLTAVQHLELGHKLGTANARRTDSPQIQIQIQTPHLFKHEGHAHYRHPMVGSLIDTVQPTV